MELIEKTAFLQQGQQALAQMYDMVVKTPTISWQTLDKERTAVIVLDLINGFAKEGALASPRVEKMIAENVRLCQAAQRQGIEIVAFADEHTMRSPEFAHFPPHALQGTSESEIVEELAAVGGYVRLGKNSTNGFLAPAFTQWLQNHEYIQQFILIGDCTDICVLQMAQTLKAWFNQQDRASRLIVPWTAVETYTLSEHDGDLLNIMALYLLALSGVEIVRAIEEI